jgi:hypothetical protein
VHGEGGQATVEWVALVLTAALVLAGAGALAGREADRELGEEVAERITSAAAAAGGRPPAAAGGAPEATAPGNVVRKRPISGRFRTTSTDAVPRVRAAPPAPASAPRAVDAFRSLRGVADVARHTWIVCLGYRRWRYELEHPMAPTESLPLDEALGIANSCLNPYDYLLED